MSKSDSDYYTRRLEAERAAARASKDPRVVASHEEMARYYASVVEARPEHTA